MVVGLVTVSLLHSDEVMTIPNITGLEYREGKLVVDCEHMRAGNCYLAEVEEAEEA